MDVIPSSWRADQVQLDSFAAINPSGRGLRFSITGQLLRRYLDEYFNSVRAVYWQENKI
jgi:hypothetical protein